MKSRRITALWIVAAMVMALLAGCGGEKAADNFDYFSDGGIYDNGADMELSQKPMDEAPESVNEISQQKLIKTVNISAETEDLTRLLDDLTQQVAELGGYVENRNVYNGSAYSSSRNRSADMVIRIPADSLNGFVTRVQGLSNIISTNEKVDDVTLTYVAVESRMKALETEQQRLLELMENAQTMSELLEVESRLTDVVSELESVTSQLRVLQNRVDYATVNLSIREVRTLTVVEEETVWQRMTRGFGENLKGLGDGIVEFAIFLVVSLPYLVPLGAIAAVVIVLLRRRKTKKKAAKAVPFETNIPENQENKE